VCLANPDANLVRPEDACPRCGERNADLLVWHDDEVECGNCGALYTPGRAPPDSIDGDPRLWRVIDAAAALLTARQDKMVTREEWDALARAVAACATPGRAAPKRPPARHEGGDVGPGDARAE